MVETGGRKGEGKIVAYTRVITGLLFVFFDNCENKMDAVYTEELRTYIRNGGYYLGSRDELREIERNVNMSDRYRLEWSCKKQENNYSGRAYSWCFYTVK